MIRWKPDPLYVRGFPLLPTPFSPVHNARKLGRQPCLCGRGWVLVSGARDNIGKKLKDDTALLFASNADFKETTAWSELGLGEVLGEYHLGFCFASAIGYLRMKVFSEGQ
jgi:hypothetical protein